MDSAVVYLTVDSETLERLKEISRRAGATLFAVVLGAFATLLMRYSEQEDFIIGFVMSARVRPEVDDVMGFLSISCLSALICRAIRHSTELVLRAREIILGAHEYGAYPFVQLVEVMRPKRGLHTNPFARVFLNMLNLWDRNEVLLPNLSIRPIGGLDLHVPTDFSGGSGGVDLTTTAFCLYVQHRAV